MIFAPTTATMTKLLLATALLSACSEATKPSPEVPPGGVATSTDVTENAFGHPVPTLSRDRERSFFRGRALFRDVWVTAPSSTRSRDGLGPLFNARSCDGCHIRDGRGQPPSEGQPMRTMLVRLSLPGAGAHGEPAGEPSYGGQLQPFGIQGVPGEGEALVSYEEMPGHYGDGEAYSLRRPSYRFAELSYGGLAPGTLISPRVAPAVIGLGLLAAVPEATILAAADPDDADGDGISGRPNMVWDVEAGRAVLGRFGHKANQPSLRQQVAGAFSGDIGITSSIFPEENCTAVQTACKAAPSGGSPELEATILDDVTFYSGSLSVPARRDADNPEVVRGAAIFANAGCARCHTPELETGPDAAVPELAAQRFRPFTDLLLHDLGPGLADGRPDFLASASEWRTPPLWGVGLVATVNGHGTLLHDGRARNFAEAILWHGGEAEAARERFRLMAASERQALLRFLESL
jgi:CxxC motif-containing protein (DUF1111 family)